MEQIENDRKRIDFERRLETLEKNLMAFEDGMTKTDGNTADFMKVTS
jgi:Pyruvate/2-oxoacid:ferredoxin oxidoreductase gamma subunit